MKIAKTARPRMRPPPPLRNENSSSSALVSSVAETIASARPANKQDQDVDVAQRTAPPDGEADHRGAGDEARDTNGGKLHGGAGWYRRVPYRTERPGAVFHSVAMASPDRHSHCPVRRARERRGRGATVVVSAERLLILPAGRQPRRGGVRGRPRARHVALERPAPGHRQRARRHTARDAGTRCPDVRPRAQRPELRDPADRLRPRARGRPRHPAARVRTHLAAGPLRKLAGRVRHAPDTSRPLATPASRPRWPVRTARWPHGSPSRSHGRRIVRAALKSRGRFRHPFTLRGRGRANDVVAGAGTRRDVRRVGARRRDRGARQAFIAAQVERRAAARQGTAVRDLVPGGRRRQARIPGVARGGR